MKIFNKKLERTDKINLVISGVILFLGLMLIILSPATDYAPITMLYLTFMVYSLIKILEYLDENIKKGKFEIEIDKTYEDILEELKAKK